MFVNIIHFMEIIITRMVGFGFPDITFLTEYYANTSYWTQALAPQYLIPSLFYFLTSMGLFSLCVVFPFRLLKKLIGYPSRKGSEK